ncbi:TonB-dependent receptor domain-containing protein [Gaetbulibacter saemankumensis]|uniref:TonB-dependent receptor domain-containing protein n=1 Tax=Gaetbulibacter saemankumensis TaxID=311208 RepID=UPI000402E4B7|nr:TonB-dependent receptor [Gaetbulibacter saemankumensis]
MNLRIAILFFFCTWYSIAQEGLTVSYSSKNISEVFTELEAHFDIKFSFNSELVNNRLVSLELNDATLEDILSELEKQVSIRFKKESERYYTVKSKRVRLTDTQELDEVLIEEYLGTGIRKTNENTSVIVSPKSLGIVAGLTEPDVLQSIQLIPGVQSPSETASGLHIRGGTPDQNLILWDGIKMYYSGHFFGTISAFNPYITDQITLYRNGTKSEYGNRISGVIDITSDSDLANQIHGGAGFNMTHADAFIKAPISKSVGILVSARRSITDFIDTRTFRNLSERVFQETKISEGNKVFEDDEVTATKDLFYFTDFTVKAIVKPNDNNEISISSLFTKNKLDYGFLIEAYEEASTDKLDIENKGLSMNWNHDFNQNLSHKINVYNSRYDFDYSGTNSISDEFSDALLKKNNIDDFGASYHLDWVFNKSSSIGFGYQYSWNEVEYDLNFSDSESPEDNYHESNLEANNMHALYADYSFRLEQKFLGNLGMRTNYFSLLDKTYFEPRLNMEYYLNSGLRLKVSGEILHQTISEVVEFNTQQFGLENRIWILSNGEDVPILKSSQATAGFIYNKNGWNIDIEGYYRNIEGLTSFTLGFDNLNELFSVGKSNILGVDLLVKKKINNYKTWLSYTFMNNDFTFPDLNDGGSFSGNTDITHSLNWTHTFEWNKFNFSLGWNIRSGIPYTKATDVSETTNGPVINYEKTNGSRLPGYDRLDVSATYKFNWSRNERWKGKLGVSFLNIYDKKNVLSRTYEAKQSLEENAYVLREVNKQALGFTPNLVFRVEF